MKKNGIVSGLFWTFSERITAQLVTVLVTIILARLLTPEHYGIISIVTVFITLCNVFVTSGFGSAVVQKKDANDKTFNTAFIISFVISIFLYIIIFIFAPFIAKIYEMDVLTLVIRIMALRLPLASFNSIQQAYIRRNMQFKKFFISTLIGTVISAIIGIVIAYNGGGVWALVSQYLTNNVIDTIILFFVSGWCPKLEVSKKEIKYIFSFGWKVLLTDLIATLEVNIRNLIVGKYYGSADLAYLDQGQKYPALVVNNINASINKVMLPAYSKEQENKDKLKKLLRTSVKMGLFILAPIMIGFAVISNNFVAVVLTEKWMPCVPFIQIFCLSYLMRPLETSCHQALLAIGKSGIVLKIMIVINVFALAADIFVVFFIKKVIYLAIASLIYVIISLIGFMTATTKYINYQRKEQFQDVFPYLIASFIMGGVVLLLNYLPISKLIIMILQIAVGGLTYLLLAIIFKLEAFVLLKNKIVEFIKK